MTELQHCSLKEEGYAVSQQSNGTPPKTVVQKVIETLTLKELSEKNGIEHNKVSKYIYIYTVYHYNKRLKFDMILFYCRLNKTNITFYLQNLFLCNVKVQNVEEGNWWYNSCSDYEGEVEKVEGKLKCSNCTNKTIPVPEKRLVNVNKPKFV